MAVPTLLVLAAAACAAGFAIRTVVANRAAASRVSAACAAAVARALDADTPTPLAPDL